MFKVWQNRDGEYLTISESQSHCGTRYTPGTTKELNQAYVTNLYGARMLERKLPSVFEGLIARTATVQRIVKLED